MILDKNSNPTVGEILETLEYGPAPESSSIAQGWLDDHGRAFGHFIDGKWVKPEGRKVYETKNPATGKIIEEYCCMIRASVPGNRNSLSEIQLT